MISQILKIQGLVTNPSYVSDAPPGSLRQAENIVLKRDSIAEPIKGMNRVFTDIPGVKHDERLKSLYKYNANLLAQLENKLFLIKENDKSKLVSEHIESEDAPLRYAQSDSSLYINTDRGLLALDDASTCRNAGIAKTYITHTDISQSSGAGILKSKHIRAYRILHGSRVNSRDIIGPPSPMVTAYNKDSQDQQLSLSFKKISIPGESFYEIYRTEDLDTSNLDLDNPETFKPIDEMYLVARVYYSQSLLEQETITFTDKVPFTQTGKTLYTSPSQEGSLETNDAPPYALDMCEHKSHMFFSNISNKPFLDYSLDAFNKGDSFTLGNETYTCADKTESKFDPTTGNLRVLFKHSDNKYTCAKNLIDALNLYSRIFTAELTSLPSSSKLDILIISKSKDSFTLTANGIKSEAKKGYVSNGLMFSKPFEYEAVPKINLIRIEDAENSILRIISLKDSLIIFKSYGIYRLYGDEKTSFGYDCLDSTIRLVAPNSPAKINNQIFALCDQGIVVVSENGISIISNDISNLIDRLCKQSHSSEFPFGLANARRYYLFTKKETYVYNLDTLNWSSWSQRSSCGLSSEGLIYLAHASLPVILRERNLYTKEDYLNYVRRLVLSEFKIEDNSAKALYQYEIKAHDVVYATKSNSYHKIIRCDPIDEYYKLLYFDELPPVEGSHHLNKPIKSTIEWASFHAGYPSFLKHFREVQLIFNDEGIKDIKASLSFSSDLDKVYQDTDLDVKQDAAGWGQLPWGQFPWGGEEITHDDSLSRILVPTDMQRCHRLSIKLETYAIREAFQLCGLSLTYRHVSQKGIRSASN